MGFKERCCYCQIELDSVQNKTTNTEDKHKLCIDCYHAIFNVLFKGQFTYAQGLEALHLRLKYEGILAEYLLKAKKLGKVNNENYKEVLDKMVDLENKICMNRYNSDRQPRLQNISEHYGVIKTILDLDLLEELFKIPSILGITISSNNVDYDIRLLDIAYKSLTSNLVTIV